MLHLNSSKICYKHYHHPAFYLISFFVKLDSYSDRNFVLVERPQFRTLNSLDQLIFIFYLLLALSN